MIQGIRHKIWNFFNKGHERTVLTKKNIAISFVIKGVTILISTIMVPLTIGYVNPERNGLWLTLYSMVVWLNLFDIGFGNGMKNRVAEAKAVGDNALARRYVSSTYAVVALICVGIFAVFCLLNPLLDWPSILKNRVPAYDAEITGLVWIFMTAFCFTFVLNLLKSVVMADQRPAIAAFLDMLGQLLTLAGVFILSKTAPPSLVTLGLVTGFAPVVVYVVASIYLFTHRYSKWRPSVRAVSFGLAGNMLNLGLRFFIATCASFMVSQTLNFLIQRMTNSTEVTNYNTAFRLFAVVFNITGIIVMPYWSAFTDAFAKQDYVWMKRSVNYLNRIFLVFMGVQILLLALSPLIYYFWVNHWMQSDKMLDISFFMSVAVFLHVCTLCWSNMYIYPLNGIGKVKLQVISAVFELVLMLPLAWWFGRMWGAPGIVLASAVIYLPRMVWAPLQLNRLINNRATGLWNK
jgi:O-antigen/teichoic acid export membrane protein